MSGKQQVLSMYKLEAIVGTHLLGAHCMSGSVSPQEHRCCRTGPSLQGNPGQMPPERGPPGCDGGGEAAE